LLTSRLNCYLEKLFDVILLSKSWELRHALSPNFTRHSLAFLAAFGGPDDATTKLYSTLNWNVLMRICDNWFACQ